MYSSHQDAGARRWGAGLATLAIHAAVIGGLAWGLSFADGPQSVRSPGIVAVDLDPPPPPPPPPPTPEVSAAAPRPAAPEGAKAMPREAPPVAIPFPMPAAAPTAADGSGATVGTSAQGTGPGAGGTGDGDGGGGSGTGSPARRIAGELRNSDYPREAEAARLSGTVGISFRVRTEGSVDRCTVVQSSGSGLLDDLTCRLFTQRFRFRPASDATGRAVESTLQTSFTWGIRRRR